MSVILASAGYDGTIKFWDALSGVCSRTISVDNSINRLEITSDKRLLAAGGPPVRLYDLSRSKMNPIMSYDEQGTVTSLVFGADDNWLVTGSEDGTIKVWDTRAPNCQRSYENGSPVNDVVIHPNQGEILSCDRDGNVKVWDLGKNKAVKTYSPTASYYNAGSGDEYSNLSLNSLAISSNASMLLAATKYGDVFQWSLKSDQHDDAPIKTLKAHNDYITRILLSSDAKHLATCSADSTAKIWNTSNFELETMLDKHKRWVWDCAFSADSAYLVTASSDGYVRLWDLATNEVVREYGGINGHSKPVTCCALNDI